MIRTLKGAIICSAIAGSFVAFSSQLENASAGFQKSKGRVSTRAKRVDELFKQNCARCHAANGTGDTPLGRLHRTPDFTDPEWWREGNRTPQRLATVVARGKEPMPAFGKKLTKAQINLLVDHVRRFKKAL